jgi:hypothetical protein
MTIPIEIQLLTKIRKAKRGTLFFIENFISNSNTKTVGKTLERLVTKGELMRVSTGIYTRPVKSSLFGYVTPGIEEIAKAIAKRDKARIVPTGAFALHILGLTTQVPVNVVYLTDGASRKIRLGKQTIIFKKVVPKNLAAIGHLSRLVIQALKTLGKNNITLETEKKILDILRKEKNTFLEQDIRLAPEWIRQIMKKAIKIK